MSSSSEIMTQARALSLLRRITPWATELPKGPRENYKGVRGRIGIVGGARDYAGAPYFAAISAMRLGADLAYVICSEKAGQVIKGYSPDLIATPLLDCQDESTFDSEMNCLLTRLHALVIGPGLGREKLLQARAKKLIEAAKARSLPLVLDADSLLLINEDPSIIRSYPKALITPNRIELQRLLESIYAPKSFNLREMKLHEVEDLVKQCSENLGVTILAKGIVDIVASKSGLQLTTDATTGSDRRCGGQGDILSGLAGVYMHWMEQGLATNSQGLDLEEPNKAAWAGYLAALTTRKTNELAYREFKGGMLASHMIDKIYNSFETLLNESKDSVRLCPSDRQVEVAPSNRENGFAYAGSLTQDEINRYRRQMIMQDFGPERQIRLRESSALIVGAGGLGCPVAVYLAAAGIGRLGLVDHDVVEVSNFHRQILHNLRKVGMLKTESIKEAIHDINPNVRVDTHSVEMDRHNAIKLIEGYDMVIDATDNLLTRYMISDACVVAKKPLISGAALGMDGQLTVYNYDKDTPCFRCLFPEPPPSAAVGSCSENGVLGVVPGIIGVQQAMEAIRLAAGLQPAYAGKMLLFDGQLGRTRQVTLSRRRNDCPACGAQSSLGPDLVDYESFLKVGCTQQKQQQQRQQQGGASTSLLEESERISLEEYCDILKSNRSHVLIDVRPLAHSEVSRFAHALQIPVSCLSQDDNLELIRSELETKNTKEVFVVCRRGIASQTGVRLIQDALSRGKLPAGLAVKDLVGGMTGWTKQIDPSYSCL